MPKKLIIIANWKMNPLTIGEALQLAHEIENDIRGMKNTGVVIAPPFPFLAAVRKTLKKSRLGAQDVFWREKGAYTGEVSPNQLKRLGVTCVIIGHSERRINLGETDEMLNKKIKAALKTGLVPVLAVGERKKMPAKKTRKVIARQLSKALAGVSSRAFRRGIIAYEPVWAIGAGRSAAPEHARMALSMIKEILAGLWKTKKVSAPILYGGSVNSKNAAKYVSKKGGGMDGLLVGGASLSAKEFIGIVRAAGKINRLTPDTSRSLSTWKKLF